jgi:hypothetical protein
LHPTAGPILDLFGVRKLRSILSGWGICEFPDFDVCGVDGTGGVSLVEHVAVVAAGGFAVVMLSRGEEYLGLAQQRGLAPSRS